MVEESPSRLEHDRRLDDDRGVAGVARRGDATADLLADQRMDERVQTRERRGISKDDLPERPAIDRAVGPDDPGAEGLDDARESLRPGEIDLVTDPIGVDHVGAELAEDRGHRALPRADAAGQPDHGGRRHARPQLPQLWRRVEGRRPRLDRRARAPYRRRMRRVRLSSGETVPVRITLPDAASPGRTPAVVLAPGAGSSMESPLLIAS